MKLALPLILTVASFAAVGPAGGAAAQTQTPPATETASLAPTAATVHVVVTDVDSAKGNVWVALCDTSLSLDGCPYKLVVPAAAGAVSVTFKDVPPGDYGVTSFHDENGDDKFNMVLGVPREPYAISGEAGEALVPTLSKAVQKIARGDNEVVIRMKHIGG